MRVNEFPAQDFISTIAMFFWIIGALKRDQIESLESFQIYWKIPRPFTEGLKMENSQSALTEGVKRQLGKFPDSLKNLREKKIPVGLDNFQMAWNVSRWPGKFPDCLETFFILQKLSRFTKTFQVALLPCYLGFSASGGEGSESNLI